VDAADYTVWRDNLGATLFPAQAPALIGDYNEDGTVDAADYTAWRDTLGRSGLTPYSEADGNGSGNIDAADYEIWSSNFGASTATGGSAAVSTEFETESLIKEDSLNEMGDEVARDTLTRRLEAQKHNRFPAFSVSDTRIVRNRLSVGEPRISNGLSPLLDIHRSLLIVRQPTRPLRFELQPITDDAKLVNPNSLVESPAESRIAVVDRVFLELGESPVTLFGSLALTTE
jgi:hypothetical protein